MVFASDSASNVMFIVWAYGAIFGIALGLRFLAVLVVSWLMK